MNKCRLAAIGAAMIPAALQAQTLIETCEGLPVNLTVDVPTEIAADSAQWFLNSNPVGLLELNPTTSTWYEASVEYDDSGLYEYIVWHSDSENQVQDSVLASWQVTVWESLTFTSLSDTFDLCAFGVTDVELGVLEGGSGNFEWNWTALGPSDTLVVDLPASLIQSFGPAADSSMWRVTIEDLEGCGSISSPTWIFETQDTLNMSLGIMDGNGVDGSWCHGQSIEFMGTQGYAEYHWILEDEAGTTAESTTDPFWASPQLTSVATVFVQATNIDGCLTASDEMSLSILDAISAPTLPELAPICFGEATIFFLELEATPSELNWIYEWTHAEGEVFDSGTSASIENLTTDFEFYVQATSLEGCGSVASASSIQPVFQELAPPVIAHSNEAYPDTACFGASDFELILTEEAAPEMAFTYQWYVNGQPVAAANGGSSVPFTMESLTADVDVFVEATSVNGCGVMASASLVQAVFPELAPPVITTLDEFIEDTLCYGTEGFTVLEIQPAASNMSFSYTWFVDGVEIVDESEATYVLPALQASPEIVLEVNSLDGCGTLSSNALYQPVFGPISQPVVEFATYNPADTLCNGDDGPVIIQDAPPLVGMAFTYAWLNQSQSGPLAIYPSNNTPSLDVSSLTETTSFAIEATSANGCGTYVSNFVEVPVFPLPQDPVIDFVAANPILPICFGAEAPALELTASPAQGMAFDWQWMNADGNPIEGENSTIFDGTTLELTSGYILSATSVNGCGTWVSNQVTVEVWPALSVGSTAVVQDIICYDTPAGLSSEGATGGNGEFNVQWLAGTAPNQLNPVSDSNESPWISANLQEATWFAPLFVSEYGCGEISGEPILVEVLPGVNAGVLSGADSICFGSTPQTLTVTNASGADGNFSSLWLEWTGTSWTQVQMNGDSYEPGSLTETTRFRCDFVSEFGCGTYPSNEVEVHVFSPFVPATLQGDQLICYGSAPENLLAVGPAGGGDDYFYEWAVVTNLDTLVIPGENNPSLAIAELFENTSYILETASSYGCGEGWSNVVEIQVADPLAAGSFEVNPNGELCAHETVSATGANATGGIGAFEWTWLIGSENSWEAIGDELELNPIQLSDTVQLTLTFGNECGTVSADTTTIIVNPLPQLGPLNGDLSPCASSVANYLSIGSYNPAIDYSWSSNSSSIEITSGESGPAILYNHSSNGGPVQFEVTLEYTDTGCISDSIYTITPSLIEAPPLGFVEQKPGLDLLICSDSTDCAQYQWGILNPESNAILWIPGETDQFLFYEGLENENGVFCVEVIYDCGDGEVSCPTVMYWNYTPFLAIEFPDQPQVKVYPNPFTNMLSVDGATAFAWQLFDQFGRLVCAEQNLSNCWGLPEAIDVGTYMLLLETDLGPVRQVVIKQ